MVSAACDESITGPSPNAASAAPSVAEGVWRLQAFRRADSTVVTVSNPDRFTIEVGTGGRISVRADCNRCSASYSQSSGSLRLDPAMACTRAACASAPFDTEYVSALSDAILRTSGDSLESVSKAGVLTFTK